MASEAWAIEVSAARSDSEWSSLVAALMSVLAETRMIRIVVVVGGDAGGGEMTMGI